MLDNAFRGPISVDRAPEGHLCDWCCKPAVHQLTAIGGICHNQGGFYCPECAEEFAHAVTESMNRILLLIHDDTATETYTAVREVNLIAQIERKAPL